MKYFLIVTALSVFSFFEEQIHELNPTLGYLVDKSREGETEFIRGKQECELLSNKVIKLGGREYLSKPEEEIYNNCDDYLGSYWDILGPGDSWYDAGIIDTLSASSQLPDNNGIYYIAGNAHDLNYKTAWVEGVNGYGIGEMLTYHFAPQNPRITKVIIVNGYVKSHITWEENSRVKKLKMYLNDKPIAILNLLDSRQEQSFTFEPIGMSDREDMDELMKKAWWTLKFEIMEVYKGNKYDDTAITEIYFDGIDIY